MGGPGTEHVAVGFRVKTGRAVAVELAGPVKAPRVVARRELVLHDGCVLESFQPYHAGLGLAPREAEPTVRRLSEIVRKASLAAVEQFIDELDRAGLDSRAAGIVVGSLVDPNTIKRRACVATCVLVLSPSEGSRCPAFPVGRCGCRSG